MRIRPLSKDYPQAVHAGRRRLAAALIVTAVAASCTPELSRLPTANPRLEQPNALSAEWAAAAMGNRFGLRWTLESRKSPDGRICARLLSDPPLPPAYGRPSGTPPEACGKVGVGYSFVSIVRQSNTLPGDHGYILGLTDPSVTEIRLDMRGEEDLELAVDRQAFAALVEDAFAIKACRAYRRGERVETQKCEEDGSC